MVKKIRRYIIGILIFALSIECVLLVGEAHYYKVNKASHMNINGRIVSEIDNLVNFSGMAEN
jgi:Tfp pilus assembly PilM family ATPase